MQPVSNKGIMGDVCDAEGIVKGDHLKKQPHIIYPLPFFSVPSQMYHSCICYSLVMPSCLMTGISFTSFGGNEKGGDGVPVTLPYLFSRLSGTCKRTRHMKCCSLYCYTEKFFQLLFLCLCLLVCHTWRDSPGRQVNE